MINVLLLYMTSPSEMNHKTCRSSISCKSYAINLNDDEETTALKLQLKMQRKLMKEYQERKRGAQKLLQPLEWEGEKK